MALNIIKNLLFISLYILFILYADYNIILYVNKSFNNNSSYNQNEIIINNNNNNNNNNSNNLLPSQYNQIAIRNNNNNKVSIIDNSLYNTKQLNITIKYNNYNYNNNNNKNYQVLIPHFFNKGAPVSLLLARKIIENNNCAMFPNFPCYALNVRDSILNEFNNLSVSGYQRVEIFIGVNYDNGYGFGYGYAYGYQFNLFFIFISKALNNFLNYLNEIISNLNLVNNNIDGQNNLFLEILFSIFNRINSTFKYFKLDLITNLY